MATGCRVSRRGAPGPQGALRPLGPQGGPRSRFARSKRSLGVAFRPYSAHAADGPRAAAFDRLLMAAIIPPRRAPPALAPAPRTLPQGRLRKPSAHHPDGLARYGFRYTESSCRPLGRGGEPLATARSRRMMGCSLRLAPIKSSRWQTISFACKAAVIGRVVGYFADLGFARSRARGSGVDTSPRYRCSVLADCRYWEAATCGL